MAARGTKRTKRVVGVLGVISLVVALKFLGAYLFCVKRYHIVVDPVCSPNMHHVINSHITNIPGHAFSAPAVFQQLKAKFPTINRFSTQLLPSGTMYCQVDADKPLVTINERSIITKSGIVGDSSLYATHRVARLYNIHCDAPQTLDVHSARCIEQIPVAILSRYHVQWISECELVLQDKNDPTFSIMCTAHMLPDVSMIDQCRLCKDACAAQGPSRRMQLSWIADVRFNQQIVIYAQKGGTCG